MNWLSNFIRPKIRSMVSSQKEVPDNLWTKCPSCEGMLFQRDLKERLSVCNHCNYHMRWPVAERLAHLFDRGQYENLKLPRVPVDPLKFKDRKKYTDRLNDARKETGREDAMIVAVGTIDSAECVVAAFDFDFMGGSMGTAVGESIVMAATEAVKRNLPLLVIPSSGGARMQEGALSLMQMPRTIIATQMVKEAGLPYIVLLTDPTTGGVSASFAMVGDVHIAEPGSMIGFAGKRVIQETIREALPERFQTAEYLVEHGMVDMVVPRDQQRQMIARLIGILTNDGRGSRKTADGGSVRGNSNLKASTVLNKARAAGSVAAHPANDPLKVFRKKAAR
ncbi:MAG: acetyl-CoA carboxylase carboxyltransferase subunit beta [Proteobacteria bacterium]|nr:acetyl-CoA carboxylase carboxyltransferase subunit beta [Pseudomonadota bacterium]